MSRSLPLAFVFVAMASHTFAAETATATMFAQDGQTIGEISVLETPHGIIVQAALSGLSSEGHGFHIHETGSCAEDFSAAGGHFNPHDRGHGHTHEGGSHVGDLPNIYAAVDGTVRVDFVVPELTFSEGDAQLFDADGSAFIVHAMPDTYGESAGAGGRIACGVISQN